MNNIIQVIIVHSEPKNSLYKPTYRHAQKIADVVKEQLVIDGFTQFDLNSE